MILVNNSFQRITTAKTLYLDPRALTDSTEDEYSITLKNLPEAYCLAKQSAIIYNHANI